MVAAALALTLACASGPGPAKPVAVPLPPPGRPMADLMAALSAPSAEERRAAAWALAGADTVPPEVRAALSHLRDRDPDEQVRLAAVWAIGHVAEHPENTSDAYDQPPRLVKQTRPVYPPNEYKRMIQGTVTVEVLIDEQGAVAHAEVRESIPALDAAALATVRQWQFRPAMKGGRPVATTATAPVTFRIY
jgi:periplasmic protein TonB